MLAAFRFVTQLRAYSYTNSAGARASACTPQSPQADPKPKSLGRGWGYQGSPAAVSGDRAQVRPMILHLIDCSVKSITPYSDVTLFESLSHRFDNR